MKLVEILAKKLDVWPSGAAIAVQDGDKRKTVKFGSKHANPSIALMGLKDVWQARDWKYTYQSDFDHSVLASDWKTAIVTKKQWQAERDRQKGGEWKRHRGGKCPVSENSVIDVKLDTGDTMKNEVASDWEWSHQDVHPRIMQYRIISQPQAEEVEAHKFTQDLNMHTQQGEFVRGPISLGDEVIYPAEAKWDRVDGPLLWRDTVNELDAYIEEFTRERDALIELLASEGFSLIPPVVSVMSEFEGVDMGDWRNWKAGDSVTYIHTSTSSFTDGWQYTLEEVDEYRVSIERDDEGDANGWLTRYFKWHSRQ